MGYRKLKDAIVNAKSGDNWFMDLVNRKASPEARERIKNGIRMDQEPSFFKTDDGNTVPVYTDKDGISTVFEADLKKVNEDTNLAKFDVQLRECGMEEYSRASFESINTYKFLKKKFPRDLVPMFDVRPMAYFYGGAGTGKTTLACAIGRDFARRGYPIVIRRWTNWLTQFREVYDDSSEMVITDHMKKAQNASLLILDEIGTDKKNTATEFEIEQLSRIVSDRYGNGKPMIITSNIDPDKLERIYGAQISSRITDQNKSFLQRFDGETNYRQNRRAALIQPALETF
tara:strand:+ start:1067 stop:1927 length:861 start_codon:yes stop_codon:yes gene_type:complete